MLTQCIWSPRKTLCAWTPGTYTNACADCVKGHQNHRPVVLESLPGTEHPTQHVRQAHNLCSQCINVTYVFSQCLYRKALCSLPCLCWHSYVCHSACSLHLWLNMIQQSRTNWTWYHAFANLGSECQDWVSGFGLEQDESFNAWGIWRWRWLQRACRPQRLRESWLMLKCTPATWTETSQIISWYYIECMILWFGGAGGIRIKSLWQLWDSTKAPLRVVNIRKTACKMVSFGSCFPIQNVRNVAEDTWLSGKVARIAGFGAFVTVSAPEGGASADGLLTPFHCLWGLSILQIFGICSHASGMARITFDYHIILQARWPIADGW